MKGDGEASQAVLDVLRQAVQGRTADTVFGDPIARGDATLIPVARVRGRGGGGGSSRASEREGAGGGGVGSGLKLSAEPAGVFVARDGQVRWQPSLDLNRVILGGQLVVLVGLLVARDLLPRRAQARRRWSASRTGRGLVPRLGR